MFSRNLILLAFIGVCFVSCVQSNFIDDGVYAGIKAIIDVRYPDKSQDERQCMVDTFRKDDFVAKFSKELSFDHKKLEKALDPYWSEVSTKCEWITFIKTPLGICIIVGIILILLSMICGLIKCICC